MAMDMELLRSETAADELFAEAELSRVSTLIGSVLDDVRVGAEYPGFAVTYDEASNTAKWSEPGDFGAMDATLSVQNGTSMMSITEKLWDEAGYDAQTTTVTITGSEGRMTRTTVRNNGIVLKPARTEPLDRATYDSTLENLVNLKRFDTQGEQSLPARRRLTPGWLRAILGR